MSRSNDTRLIAQQNRRERDKAAQADLDFIAVAKTPEGQRYLWSVMVECCVFRTVWHPSAQIHLNEGRRQIGLKVLANLTRLCPQEYLQMILYNASDIKKSEAADAAVQLDKTDG